LEILLVNNGLLALFLLSFLAATIIPLGSEWLLIALILNGFDARSVVAVATLGNYLGACTTYAIGFYGSEFLIKKILRVDDDSLTRAMSLYKKYGSWSLLFSWIPILGDPLCLAGGVLRLGFPVFSVLVFLGKFARYAAIAYLTVQI
jgi:membrane protein YqaA with SNARE-associated domain